MKGKSKIIRMLSINKAIKRFQGDIHETLTIDGKQSEKIEN